MRRLFLLVPLLVFIALQTFTYSAMTVGPPTPSSQTIDLLQTAVMTSTGAAGGKTPYTYQWFVELPGTSTFISANAYCAAPTSLTCSFSTTAGTQTGSYAFLIEATDSSSNPKIVNSSTALVTVNAPTTTTTTTSSTTTLTTTSTTTASTTVSTTSSTTALTTGSTTPPTTSVTTSIGTTTSSIASSTSTVYTTASTTVPATTVPVNRIQVIESGAGGPPVGSAEEVPVLLSYINTTNSTSISNMTQFDFVEIAINHEKFMLLENFITPDYAVLTVNNREYTFYPNESLLIRTTADDRYYIKLLDVNITPAVDTISIEIYVLPLKLPGELLINSTNASIPITLKADNVTNVGFPLLDTLISLSSQMDSHFTLSVADITQGFQRPLPNGYTKYSIFNVSLVNKSSQGAITLQMITGYDCNASKEVIPFKYSGGTWTQIQHFSYNTTECEINITVLTDPIIALLEKTLPGSPTISEPLTAATDFILPGYYALPGGNPVYISNASQFRNFVETGNARGILRSNPTPNVRIAFNNTLYNFYSFNGSVPALSLHGVRLSSGVPIRFAYSGFKGISYYWWPSHEYISALPIQNQTEFNEYNGAMRRNVH